MDWFEAVVKVTINNLWPVANSQYGVIQEICWAVEHISLRICVDTDIVLGTAVGRGKLASLGAIVGPPCVNKKYFY